MIRKISHLIGLNKIHPGDKYTLKYDDVKVYYLKDGKNGSTLHPLKMPENGVLENIPSYDEVIKDLYEEEIFIQQKLLTDE
jgi:hypothetical protein